MKYFTIVFIAYYSVFVNASIDKNAEFSVGMAIEDFGIYQRVGGKLRHFSADSVVGYQSVMGTRLVEETSTIPLKKNVVFGFNYKIYNSDSASPWLPVMIRYRHPAAIDYTGEYKQGFSQQSAARLHPDGSYRNGAFYVFSQDNEMVPGEWEISVIYRDEVLVSQRFIIGSEKSLLLAP